VPDARGANEGRGAAPGADAGPIGARRIGGADAGGVSDRANTGGAGGVGATIGAGATGVGSLVVVTGWASATGVSTTKASTTEASTTGASTTEASTTETSTTETSTTGISTAGGASTSKASNTGAAATAATTAGCSTTGVSDVGGVASTENASTTGESTAGVQCPDSASIDGIDGSCALASTDGAAPNSSSIDSPAPTVMMPPQTEQRARTPAAGTFDGSTRKMDRHSGQETFTSPPLRSRKRLTHRPRACPPAANQYADRLRRPSREAFSRSSSFRSRARSPARRA